MLRGKLLLWILMLSFLSAEAQVGHEGALQPAQSLKEGLLIVRLDMKKNAIEAYDSVLESSTPGSKSYERIKTKRDELVSERAEYRKNVMEAFEASYRYSDYCFIENDKMDAFLQGNNSVLTCPEHVSPSRYGPQAMYYLIKGDEDSDWIICDGNFQALPDPFPSRHNIGVKRFFDFLFRKDNYSYDNLLKVFEKMQNRLEIYYQELETEKPTEER